LKEDPFKIAEIHSWYSQLWTCTSPSLGRAFLQYNLFQYSRIYSGRNTGIPPIRFSLRFKVLWSTRLSSHLSRSTAAWQLWKSQ